MSDFRKPRPDDPILPNSAIYKRKSTPFKRPRGRGGKKPKGKAKRGGQDPNFLIIKAQDEARRAREARIREQNARSARYDREEVFVIEDRRLKQDNLQLQRDRLRLDTRKNSDDGRFRARQSFIEDRRETTRIANEQAKSIRDEDQSRRLRDELFRVQADSERRAGDRDKRIDDLLGQFANRSIEPPQVQDLSPQAEREREGFTIGQTEGKLERSESQLDRINQQELQALRSQLGISRGEIRRWEEAGQQVPPSAQARTEALERQLDIARGEVSRLQTFKQPESEESARERKRQIAINESLTRQLASDRASAKVVSAQRDQFAEQLLNPTPTEHEKARSRQDSRMRTELKESKDKIIELEREKDLLREEEGDTDARREALAGKDRTIASLVSSRKNLLEEKSKPSDREVELEEGLSDQRKEWARDADAYLSRVKKKQGDTPFSPASQNKLDGFFQDIRDGKPSPKWRPGSPIPPSHRNLYDNVNSRSDTEGIKRNTLLRERERVSRIAPPAGPVPTPVPSKVKTEDFNQARIGLSNIVRPPPSLTEEQVSERQVGPPPSLTEAQVSERQVGPPPSLTKEQVQRSKEIALERQIAEERVRSAWEARALHEIEVGKGREVKFQGEIPEKLIQYELAKLRSEGSEKPKLATTVGVNVRRAPEPEPEPPPREIEPLLEDSPYGKLLSLGRADVRHLHNQSSRSLGGRKKDSHPLNRGTETYDADKNFIITDISGGNLKGGGAGSKYQVTNIGPKDKRGDHTFGYASHDKDAVWAEGERQHGQINSRTLGGGIQLGKIQVDAGTLGELDLSTEVDPKVGDDDQEV